MIPPKIDTAALQEYFSTDNKQKKGKLRLKLVDGTHDKEVHVIVIESNKLGIFETVKSWLGLGRASMRNVAKQCSTMSDMPIDVFVKFSNELEKYNNSHWLWKRVSHSTLLALELNRLLARSEQKLNEEPAQAQITQARIAILKSIKEGKSIDVSAPGFAEAAQSLLKASATFDCGHVTKTLLRMIPKEYLSQEFKEKLLLMAAEENRHKFVKALIESGVNVNVADKNGNTPFIVACANDSPETIEALMNHAQNLDLNQRNNDNKSAFSYACLNQNLPLVDKLQKRGVTQTLDDIHALARYR